MALKGRFMYYYYYYYYIIEIAFVRSPLYSAKLYVSLRKVSTYVSKPMDFPVYL